MFLLPELCLDGQGLPISDTVEYRDLNNGTIERKQTTVTKIDCLSSTTSIRTHLVKKCIQGQVYRPAPDNDCRGAGSAADNWGAQKFQWCASDNSACNLLSPNERKADPTLSAAAISCAADNFLGKKWIMDFPYDLDFINYSLTNIDRILANHPDLPRDAGHEIWNNSSNSADDTLASLFRFNSDNTFEFSQGLKSSYHYVWCRGEEVPADSTQVAASQ